MTKGKKLYEDYCSLSKEERKEFQIFLEKHNEGEFSELLYRFIESKKH